MTPTLSLRGTGRLLEADHGAQLLGHDEVHVRRRRRRARSGRRGCAGHGGARGGRRDPSRWLRVEQDRIPADADLGAIRDALHAPPGNRQHDAAADRGDGQRERAQLPEGEAEPHKEGVTGTGTVVWPDVVPVAPARTWTEDRPAETSER